MVSAEIGDAITRQLPGGVRSATTRQPTGTATLSTNSATVSGSGTLVGTGYRLSYGGGTVSGTGVLQGGSVTSVPAHEGLANWKWDKRKKKPRVIRFSDFETREALAAEIAAAALPIASISVEAEIDEWEEVEDTFIAFELMRLLH